MGGRSGGGGRSGRGGGGGGLAAPGTQLSPSRAISHLNAPAQVTPFGRANASVMVTNADGRQFRVVRTRSGEFAVNQLGAGRFDTGQFLGNFSTGEIRSFLDASRRIEARAG